MSQLSQCFGLNLPDPLTGNAENFTHFLQGACPAVIQTESQAQYILLPVSQRIQHVFKLFLQELIRCMIGWALCFLVLYEIPRWLSSSSPIGVSRDTGSWAILRISLTFSAGRSISSPISSGVGSRPRSCSS